MSLKRVQQCGAVFHSATNLSLLILLTATAWAPAFQKPADTPGERTKARLLAAVESLREIVKAERFAIPPEKLREVVLSHLRTVQAPIPRTMPAAEELRKDLNVTFDASWNEMLKRATEGLDPQVIVELERFLRDNNGLRNTAKANYDQTLEHDLPKALESLKTTLMQEQQQTLLDKLRSTVSTTVPGPQRIVEAKATDASAATQFLTDATVAGMPDDVRPTILQEAFDALKAESEQVVADGVSQLDEQLETLEERPNAVSQPAIQRGLESRLDQLVSRQKNTRKNNPLRPAYGPFADSLQLPAKAALWFDQRIADAAVSRLTKAAADKNPFTSEEAAAFKSLVVAQPSAHHVPAESLRNADMQQAIRAVLNAKQRWILDDLQQALQRSQNPLDREMKSDEFQQSVQSVLDDPDTKASNAWQELRNLMERRCETELLVKIRNTMAQEQAARWAPNLTRGSWRISESQRVLVAGPLRIPGLKQLPVWSNGPPQPDTSVLLETWNIWIEAATTAIARFDEARVDQQKIVADLEPEIVDAIRKNLAEGGQPKSDEEWITRYEEQTAAKWKSIKTEASLAYPDLFQVTLDQIRGIIAKLLPQVQHELEVEKQTPKEPAKPVPTPMASNVVEPIEMSEPRPQPADPAPTATDQTGSEGPGQGPGPGGDAANEPAASGEGEKKSNGEEGEKDGHGDGDDIKEQREDRQKAHGGSGERAEGGYKRATRAASDAPIGMNATTVTRHFSDRIFRLAFALLLVLVLLMALGWFWHVRYLRGLLARRDRMGPL